MISTTVFNAVLPLATAISMVYGGTEDAQLESYYIKTGTVVSESVVETDGGEFTWYVPTDDMSVGEKIVMICNYHDEVEWATIKEQYICRVTEIVDVGGEAYAHSENVFAEDYFTVGFYTDGKCSVGNIVDITLYSDPECLEYDWYETYQVICAGNRGEE